MNEGRDIYQALVSDSAVSALLGDRVYPGVAPDKTAYPLATYTRVHGSAQNNLGGPSAPCRHVFQIVVWDLSDVTAQDAAQTIIDAMSANFAVSDFHYMDMINDDRQASDTKLTGVALSFTFWTED